MAPKKAAVAVTDSPPTEAPQAEEKDEKKTDAATVRKLATHPSTAIMVREAIKALDSRKGVSSQAIQSYIKQNYPSVDLVRLKGLVRKALKKGIETGTLVRPANASAATGATGRFRLPAKSKEPKEKSKEPKAKSENVDPNVQKAPKAKDAKGEAKKKKPAAKKEPKEVKLSEEPKPAKKAKKNEEDVLSSKVAPAKKPKAAKKAANTEEAEETEESEPVKPKGKAKAVKKDKEKPEKGKPAQKGKAVQSKARVSKSDEAPTKAQGKRGKKASE